MSATVDSFAYTRYFASRMPRGVEPAPAIAVQGRTYRVIDFCLDDIKHVGEVCEVFVIIVGTCFKLGKRGEGKNSSNHSMSLISKAFYDA